MKTHLYKKAALFCIALALFYAKFYPVNAEEAGYKAVITCDLPSEINDYIISTNVLVQFITPSLYNDGVKLSYKLYDTDLNLLLGENERMPLEVTDGTAKAEVSIDMYQLGIAKGTDVVLMFDLVDENNIYWFSDNSYIDFEAPQIRVTYDFGYDIKLIYTNILRRQPVQLVLNIIGFIFSAVCFIKWKKLF
jgi:hypothetical protein